MKNTKKNPVKSNANIFEIKMFFSQKSMLISGIFLAFFNFLINTASAIPQSIPEARTIWEFMNEYTGQDKNIRLLNSFAVGSIGGCSGTLISPHIFMTAAHCGGPDIWEKKVRFFRIDEDKTPNQQMSDSYVAHPFHWQSFKDETGNQIGDTMLWWLEDGSDGIPPGIKYGYIGLSPNKVNVGDQAYSFWVNPVDNLRLGATLLHSFGTATELLLPPLAPPSHTKYNIYSIGGASGSSIIGTGSHNNQSVGVNATTKDVDKGSKDRNAADTSAFLAAFDADKNQVLDAIEYDLMLTASPKNFYNLRFDTPLQRAQWQGNNTDTPSNITPSSDGWALHVGGKLVEPHAYLSSNNVFVFPIAYLEDFEDGKLNTPGVKASAGQPRGPGGDTDSVDRDDGVEDNSGKNGHSFFSNNGQAGITFTFDKNILGSLPTYAGIVWTDGDGETTFEAFDKDGNSLGKIGPVAIADGGHNGTTREDRFFGAIERSGISAIKIWNSSGGIEVDHLQYGFLNGWNLHFDGKLLGPQPYLSFGDTLFPITYLEDFEDGKLNTPGVKASAGQPRGPGGDTDSVDRDDGVEDNSGTNGHSFFSNNGQAGITFTFDKNILGSLPTYAGIVWTDGDGETTFEAFDTKGNSLGKIGPVAIADGGHNGTTREDRFFGAIERSGISAIKIWNSSGGIEVDHLQYGLTKVPIRRVDSDKHYNARFLPNATYRISMAVYGLAKDVLPAYIKFQSDSSGDTLILPFEPELNGWKRITRRVTLRNHSDYRLIMGNFGNGSYHVDSITIVREDGGARLDFETDEERRTWEFGGGSYITSWGIGGSNDFSGMVVGPSPQNLKWSLRNRYAALQTNRTYNISFDVVHVSGPLTTEHFMSVQDLSGVVAKKVSWKFLQNNERKTQTLQVSTGNESSYGVTFGTTGNARFMVDNILVEEVPEVVSKMTPLEPKPYTKRSDSPLNLSGLGIDFFLEDFEDGKLNTPGAIATTEDVLAPSNITDSVDNDDGFNDGKGNGGRSLFLDGGRQGIMIAFDEHVLGSLPTKVGIVWTDGSGQTTLEAFDANWNSLGIIGPYSFADGSISGETGEDRFLGATYPDGIRGFLIRNTGEGGIEVDHLQYGLSSVTTPPCNPVVTGSKTGEAGTTHTLTYDGNSKTYFNSTYDNWQYVQIDFNCVGTLHGIRRLMTRNGSDISGNRVDQGEGCSYSLDGVNWTNFTNQTAHWSNYTNLTSSHAWFYVKYGWSPWLRLNSPVQARYVRFHWDDNLDALNEIDVDFTSP